MAEMVMETSKVRVDGSRVTAPAGFSGNTFLLLQKSETKDTPAGEEGTEVLSEDGSRGGRFLLCSLCSHRITQTGDRVRVNGSHEHTFANPHGFVFRIGCFVSAPGCIAESSETTEFTWFAGYAWRIEVCGGCFAHLGWGFRSENHRFHGLVLDRLVEDVSEDAV